MFDQLDFVVRNLPNLLIGFPEHRPGGLLLSVLLTIGGLGGGFGMALGLAIMRTTEHQWVQRLAGLIIQVIRGLPLILLLLIIQQLAAKSHLPFFSNSPTGIALLTLALYSAAYQSDIIASGIEAVPSTIVDDARVLGASKWKALAAIQLPYAARISRPALTGQVITLFKDGSVVIVLGVTELTTTARLVLGSDVRNAPFFIATYLVVGVLYLAVALVISSLSQLHERRRPNRGLIRADMSLGA